MKRRKDAVAPRSVAIIGTRGYPSYYGGFETAVRKLAPYLADQGWDVTVYGREKQVRDGDPETHPEVRSVTTSGIDSNSLSTLSYGLTSCIHAIIRKPDVAIVMNVANGYWLPLLKLRGIPTIVNVDGIEWHRAKWGKLAKAMFRWGARLTAHFGDHLVFDARAIESYWLSKFNRGGTFIPYGGEPVDKLPLEPGLSSGKYVLLVARFVPENTIAEFFDAARHLSDGGVQVVLIGSGSSGGRLNEVAQELDSSHPNIRWIGHVSDDARLFALWQHAGAYFHGHSVGGTNPALVQAMAAGAPILARDTVYNREVLAEAGTYCAPEPDAIVHGVRTLLESGASYPALAVKRASQHYNWPSVCAAYERVLVAESTRNE